MDQKVMPSSNKGHKYVLCIMNEVASYLIMVLILQSRSEEIGDTLIENVVSIYCVPNCIIMDQDSAFMPSLMNYLFKKLDIKIKAVAPFNHQSLQADHRIKSLSTILTKHLPNLGQMWTKYLLLATFAYNTFTSPNLARYSPYKLVFGRKPKLHLNLEMLPDIKASQTFKDYYDMLNKRLQYLHKLLKDFKCKGLAVISKDRSFFQYNSGDLVYIISPLTIQLHTTSRKVAIKYVGPGVIIC